MSLPRARDADVALLLEGTFPYVSGGVSSWVNQMIRAFPDVRFALAFIGSRPQDYGPLRYELPKNVVHLEVHYVHAAMCTPPRSRRRCAGRASGRRRSNRWRNCTTACVHPAAAHRPPP